MNRSAYELTHDRRFGTRRGRRARLTATIAAAAMMTLLAASSGRADCFNDLQGADDEPGQKDMSQFCVVGTCNVSNNEVSWSLDDRSWSGNNTGDACALFDNDGNGNADRAVCVTVEGAAVMQAGNPKCYTCGDDRPDRCTGSVLVACASACSVTAGADPFAEDEDHVGNACNGTNCRTLDATTTCCLSPTDAGGVGGVLIDACSYPSQQPNSDPSDCVTTDQCSKQNANDPACDDHNPCTVDSCDTTFGVCRHVPGNGGATCRIPTGVCDAAETCSGTSATCPPDQFANGTLCRNAEGLCDVAEFCDGTSAECPGDGVKPSGIVCRTATGGPCDVAEVCDGVNASCPDDGSAPNTTPCNDGDACTTGDHCDGAGGCVGGPALVCTDSNPCTDDGCNPASGCTVVSNSDPCNDDDACTTSDQCVDGTCVGGPAPDCNDGNECTTDSCDPSSGCENQNNTAPCDDANACTVNDRCGGGSCQPGTAADCNDDNACTTDTCDTVNGCQHAGIDDCCLTDAACADTDQCTTNERCVDNECVSDDVVCNDSNGCTDDSCNPATGCTYVPNSNPCNDGNACTTGDTCDAGSCTGTLVDCRDDNVCTDDSCDPDSGCVNAANSEPCNDDNACTTVDACVNKACVGSVPPNCDDGNACTDDECVAPGGCVSTPNTAPCEDGDSCTVGDACVASSCASGPRTDCNDLNGCTDDTCNSTTGLCEYVNNAAPCEDGDLCTEDDICFQGDCQPGTEIDCNDTQFCTIDSCQDGECVHTPRETEKPCCDVDADCVDTDQCTINERCIDNQCVSDPRNCADSEQCTIDRCRSEGGGFECEHIPCTDVPGSDCPIVCSGECDDGIVTPELGETCDPPGSSTPIPGVFCRNDCTFCGDGVTQSIDGETCDDGNQVEGCIKNDSFPIDACKNNCTLHVCRDPTKAVLASYIDKFTFHGRLMAPSNVDFVGQDFQVELRTPSGKVLYRTSIGAGSILSVSGLTNGPFKYVSKTAKLKGGTAKVKIRRMADAYRATVQGYGNLLRSQPDMVTVIRSGSTEWTVHGNWVKRSPKVWRFYPATAD